MAGIDGTAAARVLRGYRDILHGMCLFYVWSAYKAVGAVASGSYGTALAGWHGSPGKHTGDWNPPAGVPVWFGAKPSSSAGDVVISLGDGRVVATDYPRYGVVGVCTIAERQAQIGRPYLGWTETILGAQIALPGSANNTPTPTPEPEPVPNPSLEDDMTRIISSPLGQSLAIGDIITNFGSAEDVRASLTFADGTPVLILPVTASVHADIIAKAARRDVQRSNLPIIVRELEGGTAIYTMTDGRLAWLSDTATVQSLIDAGAVTVYWPASEITNLLEQQSAEPVLPTDIARSAEGPLG